MKNASKYFKLFGWLFMIASALNTYVRAFEVGSSASVAIQFALSLIAFGALCVLVFAKDLGKTKSYTFSGIVLLCCVASAAVQMMISASAGGAFTNMILSAVILCMMVFAKYVDKDSRGSK